MVLYARKGIKFNRKGKNMFKKLFAAALLVCGGAVGAFAADIIALDLNFYSSNGGVVENVVWGALPEGVTVEQRIRFGNPKLKGFAYPVRIDFGKTKSVKLKFVVTSGSGRLAPSLCGYSVLPDGKRGKFVFKCTKLEFGDEPARVKLPHTVKKWINMMPPWGITVEKGDIITLVAEFESAE